MEFYFLCGLIIAYFLTFVFAKKKLHKKIWTLAFIISFLTMGLSVILLRVSHHKGISIIGLDEFYILYVIATITFLLGLINAWMYKVSLYHTLSKKENEDL